MKKIYGIISICLLFLTLNVSAQELPSRPNPARFVNDIAGVLTPDQQQSLEYDLQQYAQTTTTQIVVVTVPTLQGYDVSDYAFQLGEKWGVGQKGKDNGIVVLFKPKTVESKGQVFIATGYGLEGILPDATVNQIIRNEMIPHFQQNDVYGGLVQACGVIKSLAAKEFTPQEYAKQADEVPVLLPLLFLLIFLLPIIMAFSKSKQNYYTSGTKQSSLPFWLLFGASVMGSSRHSGSWNDFSRGGGSGSGGGFGGFGGGSFGGGSFGGGGAGGSW